MWVSNLGSDSDFGEGSQRMHFADCWVESEGLCTIETQGLTQKRCATNGVDECCLDDLAQRKHVGIHNGPQGNKVDGLFGLNDLNKMTSQTAGWGLKIEERQQTRQAAKRNK